MALFTRRERPPADLVAQLAPNERVAAFADTADGQVLLASSLGLWWPGASGPRRLPWERIDKVVWRDSVLTVIEADVVDDALLVELAPISAMLSTPRDLPPTVRKRVEANIVGSELLSVGGGAVRFVARRQPGLDGVAWWARLEPGTPDTERVRSAITARLAILRAASAAERH